MGRCSLDVGCVHLLRVVSVRRRGTTLPISSSRILRARQSAGSFLFARSFESEECRVRANLAAKHMELQFLVFRKRPHSHDYHRRPAIFARRRHILSPDISHYGMMDPGTIRVQMSCSMCRKAQARLGAALHQLHKDFARLNLGFACTLFSSRRRRRVPTSICPVALAKADTRPPFQR